VSPGSALVAATGHGLGLALFPLGAAVVAAVFMVQLARRYAGAPRRRPAEGVWAVSLAMYAAASFAAFLGLISGWTRSEFRVYWLFGAILNVPYLFAGEVYLLAKRRTVAHAVLGAFVLLTVLAAVQVLGRAVHPVPLTGSLPLGKDAFGDGTLPYRLAQYYALPTYFGLLFGLVWSARGMRGNPALKDRTAGTVGIAMGATVVAIGSGIGAAFHVVPLFFASLAAGVAVMYWGFLRASRRTATART